MRLTIFLILISILQVSATTYGQDFTLSKTDISIRQIFKAIKSQTGYDILWQKGMIDVDKKLDIKFYNTPLKEVISTCVAGQGLQFEFQDQSIIIRKIPQSINRNIQQDSVIYKGRITDENGRGMAGATVKVSGSNRTTFTSSSGEFSIYAPKKGSLFITYIGYLGQEITLNGLDPKKPITITMNPGSNNLGEVNIVSTGYQDLPKERATGSFEVVTKEQLQHSSDPNLIKRLEGITTSMNFNNQLSAVNSASRIGTPLIAQNSPLANLTIRGKNTLNSTLINNISSSGAVLVVIDGIASPYPIDNVNPNDVESITVLKDAASASVWGSRAANGVIVIKTKHGTYDRPVSISFNSNFTVTDKVDLFYKKLMSTSDYIDAQIFQYRVSGQTVGNPDLYGLDVFLSPVALLLSQNQKGIINNAQLNAQLDALRGNDVRTDLTKYLLRDAVSQNYALGISGGSKSLAYRLSVGYDKALDNSIASGSDRLALNYNTSFKPLKNLEINANIAYSLRRSNDQAPEDRITPDINGNQIYPYTKLADNNGNPLSIPYRYSQAFIDLLSTTYGNKIQDLSFTPLENINEGYSKGRFESLNFNLGVNYKLTSALTASIIYGYGVNSNKQETLYRQNSFYMRNLITYYTSPDGTQSIPNGGEYYGQVSTPKFQSLRGQLNFTKDWGQKHSLNAIAGIEANQNYSITKPFQLYGYDENTLISSSRLNFKDNVPTLFDPSFVGTEAQIPLNNLLYSDSKIRTLSAYANAAYTFKQRYTLSGSIRKDMSSEFGKGTNSKGTPFFSFGGKWNISAEDFYQNDIVPILQFRATFGYNGNVNPQTVARQMIIPNDGAFQPNGLSFSQASSGSATNDQLRPEKTGILNLGLDFGLKNGRISGSFEYYSKKTTDLIAGTAVDPSTGFSRLSLNTANMHGWGSDFTLNTRNLQFRNFGWTSNFLFSYNRVKVTKLYTQAAKTAGDGISLSPGYNEGADLSRIYGYKWAGLDPMNGSPMGYLNGSPVDINSSTYNAINNQPLSTLHYFGSLVPVYYGSFRNTITYRSFSISANILYKLGYYFRRPNSNQVIYANLLGYAGSNTILGAEYSQRWQRPGDEIKTNVPALIYPTDGTRDLFYINSETNVQKADHIRLQEINVSYTYPTKKWFLKNPRVYANVSNLGIIWRANKIGLDPDILDYPRPKTYAFGFSAEF